VARLLSAAFCGLVFLSAAGEGEAEEPSLGEKMKKFFSTPTPTPSHRRHKRKQSSSTPSPTPSASPKKKKKKTKDKSLPTPSPSSTASPLPTPEESPSPSASPSPTPTPEAKVTALSPDEIENFEENPEPVRKLLEEALALTKRNLDYTYGSADPENGGMDCSGFIYYVLSQNGIDDVPRSASEQYVWVRKAGNFRAVLSRDIESFELDELKPGDLLFWTGTYAVERDPPVTHTMIYVGKEKDSGKPVMVGASDGRTYEGEKQFGVSVFDFKTARAKGASSSGKQPRFVGYAKIPGLGEEKEER
jgi:cell wall-associated NlpC family hydrolase